MSLKNCTMTEIQSRIRQVNSELGVCFDVQRDKRTRIKKSAIRYLRWAEFKFNFYRRVKSFFIIETPIIPDEHKLNVRVIDDIEIDRRQIRRVLIVMSSKKRTRDGSYVLIKNDWVRIQNDSSELGLTYNRFGNGGIQYDVVKD